MLSPKHLFKLFVKAGKAWVDDFAPSMGAAISYYTVFSLAPLLIIVIAMAGAVFGREAVQGQIVAQISGLIGQEGASLIQGIVASAGETDKGLVAGLISLGLLLIGATTVFAELQSALDRIWHVPEAEKPQGIWAILRARLLSYRADPGFSVPVDGVTGREHSHRRTGHLGPRAVPGVGSHVAGGEHRGIAGVHHACSSP